MSEDNQRVVYQCPSCELHSDVSEGPFDMVLAPLKNKTDVIKDKYCIPCFNSGDAYRHFGYSETSIRILLEQKEPEKHNKLNRALDLEFRIKDKERP